MSQEIVYEALTELSNYLERLNKGIINAVGNFRGQQEDNGIKLLIYIIEGIEWSVEVVFNTISHFENHGVRINEEQTIELLNELVQALENEDYVLIADILEYEILEIITEWQNGLKKMEYLN